MKKSLLLMVLAGILNIGMLKAAGKPNPDEANTNKVTHNKLVRTLGHGISHGYYVITHNKLTKALAINSGNTKYKNREDL